MSGADLDEHDVQAVAEVVRSGRLALGPNLDAFERAVADYVGVRHGIAVSSGTAALHLIVRALGLGAGDEVLVPSFTFAASVNALLFEDVTPVFVDIDPDTYALSPEDCARRIGPRTRGIMAVDVFGHPVDQAALSRLAERHDLRVIDDSCEALGAAYRGRPVGRFGDAAAFAFYPNKQITTGEGGIVVTDRDDLAEACRSLRNQGRSAMGAWLAHERLGYNYRMSELSAALGLSQMTRVGRILERRADVAARYTERIAGLSGVRAPFVADDVVMSWFVYVVRLADGLERDDVIAGLAEEGIPARGYFAPIHRQPYIRERFPEAEWHLPVTEEAARRTVALPFHGGLEAADVDHVVDALARVVARAGARST